MSEDLNDTLSLQNVITLQLVSNFQSTSESLDSMKLGFEAIIFQMENVGRTFINLSNIFSDFIPMLKGDAVVLNNELVSLAKTFSDVSQFNMELVRTDFASLGGAPGRKETSIGKKFGKIGKSIKGLTKSMLSATLVMKPVSSFLGELLEPVEIVTDTIGGMGSLLSVGLIPGIMAINSVLLPFLPLIQLSLPVLTFAVRALTRPLTAISPILEFISTGLTDIKAAGFTTTIRSLKDAMNRSTDAAIHSTEAMDKYTASIEELDSDLVKAREIGGFAVKETRLQNI